MSGICGYINLDGAPIDTDVLHKMAKAAAHRGLDGIHYWINGNVGFAYLALNITPESLHEQQPLVSSQGDLVLIADARVDNRGELIHTLSAKGYLTKQDPTDVDLILSAYRCWGINCPTHLIGDFSFAIWDSARQHFFAARDAMGMRAFYYRVESRRLIFATEVKQILVLPEVPKRIFEPAICAYLAGRFGSLEWTFYEGIVQLPPAYSLLVNTAGHRTWRYWDIDPDLRIEYTDEGQYAEHFQEIFKEAVKCRLRSLKPIGIFLSGGMDSGSIASTAGFLLQGNHNNIPPGFFHAYCWAFDELTQCDERHISDRILRHYGLPFTYLPAETAWPLKDYPNHGPDRDEPFIGFYQTLIEQTLMTARDEGMGLMFTGQRGDLIMGGWVLNYLDLLRARQWRALWEELIVHKQLDGIPMIRLINMHLLNPLLSKFIERKTVLLHWPMRRLSRKLRRPNSLSPEWLSPEFARRMGLTDILQMEETSMNVNSFTRHKRYQIVFTALQMRAVIWSERTHAHFGLGYADPWSDRRIATFVLAVPQQVINRLGETHKRLSRQALRGIMPEKVLQSAGKTSPKPFYIKAIRKWAKDTVLDLITEPRAAAHGYINETILRKHFESICRGEPDHHCFWHVLTLEMWLRKYWH